MSSRTFLRGVSAFVIAVSLLVLIGWAIDTPLLKSVAPVLGSMKANTAVCILECGVALALVSKKRIGKTGRIVVVLLSASVFVIALTTLGEDIFEWNPRIDRILFRDTLLEGNNNPGRMAPSTAFCFILVSSALWVASLSISQRFRLPSLTALGSTVTVIGGLALLGHAAEGLFEFRLWNYSGMAVHTGVGFVLLGCALLALAQSERRMTWSLDALTTCGFVVGIVSLMGAATASYRFTHLLEQDLGRVNQIQEVIREIERINSNIQALGSSQRFFINSGDERLLESFDQIKGAFPSNTARLRTLAAGDIDQGRRIDELESLIEQRIAMGEQIITARRDGGLAAAERLIATGSSTELATRIRLLAKNMEDAEYVRLDSQQKLSQAVSTKTFLLLPLGVFLSLSILSLGLFFLNRGVSERAEAEAQLKESFKEVVDLKSALDEHAIVAITDPQGRITFANDRFCAISKYSREELLGKDHRIINSGFHSKEFIRDLWATIGRGNVWHGEIRNRAKDGSVYWVDTTIMPFLNKEGKPRQYIAIRADITVRKRAEEEIHKLNNELEQRVIQRTAQLEAANKELEAFSYSVSHDLRSPLRTVDGFSQAVLEDYGAQLPDEAQRYLQTIRKGAQQMGKLIDDLLAFARMGRVPLSRQDVDMSRVVNAVLEELHPQREGRNVDLVIGSLPRCQGDSALLKQVWINLLSNALKYTRKCETPRVEVGSVVQNKVQVYFVRDNGTGFDMKYAGKLFGVFQRLHRPEDYEGTGVGLAIVQRVIHRHGGRIWAESAVDQGATFYFTIGDEAPT